MEERRKKVRGSVQAAGVTMLMLQMVIRHRNSLEESEKEETETESAREWKSEESKKEAACRQQA
jgi:hypothetical protein